MDPETNPETNPETKTETNPETKTEHELVIDPETDPNIREAILKRWRETRQTLAKRLPPESEEAEAVTTAA